MVIDGFYKYANLYFQKVEISFQKINTVSALIFVSAFSALKLLV